MIHGEGIHCKRKPQEMILTVHFQQSACSSVPLDMFYLNIIDVSVMHVCCS